MGCKFVCDGCGKELPAFGSEFGQFYKPPSWFQRSDKDGIQVACSRECIEKVATNAVFLSQAPEWME